MSKPSARLLQQRPSASGNGDQRSPLQSVAAVHSVAPGSISSYEGTLPLTHLEWSVIATSLRLSQRESEIARRMLDVVSESDIAEQLSIAPRTVHGHLERLYRKLRVHNRYELVVRLFSAYLLTCRPPDVS